MTLNAHHERPRIRNRLRQWSRRPFFFFFFFGQLCGCGTGCEGENGVVVVFEWPLGMAKGGTSGCWSEYGALALSSSKGALLLGRSRDNPTLPLKPQCPDSRNRRFVLSWMSTPSTVSN
jgi:hypothetical protein